MFQSIIVLDIGMILNVYTFGYRDDTKCFDDIHVGNVITRQQKGGVSDSISSQCMKVNGIHVRSVTARQQKRGILDGISSRCMGVSGIHVHRDGDFDCKISLGNW